MKKLRAPVAAAQVAVVDRVLPGQQCDLDEQPAPVPAKVIGTMMAGALLPALARHSPPMELPVRKAPMIGQIL
ncbi:MAG: hypothetical protein ACLPKI_14285 [Streptosporangiaceae bacterium]